MYSASYQWIHASVQYEAQLGNKLYYLFIFEICSFMSLTTADAQAAATSWE